MPVGVGWLLCGLGFGLPGFGKHKFAIMVLGVGHLCLCFCLRGLRSFAVFWGFVVFVICFMILRGDGFWDDLVVFWGSFPGWRPVF